MRNWTQLERRARKLLRELGIEGEPVDVFAIADTDHQIYAQCIQRAIVDNAAVGQGTIWYHYGFIIWGSQGGNKDIDGLYDTNMALTFNEITDFEWLE